MNGKKHIPGLDGYDSGESPTLSVWDEWDREELNYADDEDDDQ
ncbi:hypothetical protein CPT_Shady_038 [Streptomyces phage Shady]|uniref:Uncharacterized protein n=1 Tax=Streptomyces phage Shady TaxID=2767585 RepID=A0A873WE90_9CAUD|nr:hypothetical protein CPT_Shady_038 [Streptomyces phage Shady]